jgi:two-component system cell cycle sensor histidine kinase/response regulator CckA
MPDPRTELKTLFHAEYGGLTDLVVRVIGITAGGAMLYLHTGWAASYLWGAGFLSIHAIQYPFLRSRLNGEPKKIDVILGGGLFILVHISFIWLPTYIAAQSDPSLMLVGLLVLIITPMYHLRRADTQRWLVVAQIIIFAGSLIYVSGSHLARTDEVLVQSGTIMVAAMAVIYIALTMLSALRRQTELVEASARLVQEQKISAVGRLAGGVAHDFNNLLTVIKGNLELYEQIEDVCEKRAVLLDAHAAAERAERVVEQLLIFSRKSPSRKVTVNAAVAVQNVTNLCRTMVPERVMFETRLHSKLLSVEVDEQRLETALLNLVKNAVDAIEDNGTIRITVEAKTALDEEARHYKNPRLRPERQQVAFRISDTGHGIPASLLMNVKDPFFTTKAPGKGTGLGLSMVHGFVEDMDGGMSIESSKDGTVVSLYFPLLTGNKDGLDSAPAQESLRNQVSN